MLDYRRKIGTKTLEEAVTARLQQKMIWKCMACAAADEDSFVCLETAGSSSQIIGELETSNDVVFPKFDDIFS